MNEEVLSSEQAAARFRWARRQGHPAWLWLEVKQAAWRGALIAIEEATRAVLTGATTPVQTRHARATGLAGYTAGVGPLLGYWHERGMLACPPEIGAELARQLDHNRRRSARMTGAMTALLAALAEAGVLVAVLKGVHTSPAYFPDPATRPASDVDLLIAGRICASGVRVRHPA